MWHACALALIAITAAAGPAPASGGAATDTLTVVTLNLWHDQRDWPRRLERIVAELQSLRPDVVCLQEVLQHATLPNQAETLAARLGWRAHFVSVDSVHRAKRYGNAVLTPHPILHAGGHNLAPADDYRVVAHARLDVRGHAVDVYDTHLHHTAAGGRIRAVQIADLLAFVDSTRGSGPLVLAGDFNAERGAPEMRPLARRFANAWAELHPRATALERTTMNPSLGSSPQQIDHVFVPKRAAVRLRPVASEVLFRQVGPDSVWASDHFGVLARFALPGARPPSR